MLIDTHCHLDAAEFDGDREAVIHAMQDAGVMALVVPAVERSNFDAVRDLAAQDSRIGYTLGIHPLYVDRARDEDLDVLHRTLKQCLDDPQLLGVGEIGLDFFVEGLDVARQERFLDSQLAIARELDLPVVLHVRKSQDRVLKYLRRHRPSGGIAHAFNGSLQQAHAYLDLGFALGFGGAMTFSRALRIRALVRDLPPQAHVLETDAPDISPAWRHPERNEPAELARIADVFAQLRGIPVDDAVAQAARNAARVLPRLATRIEAQGLARLAG